MKYDTNEIFCIDSSALITMHRFYPMHMIPDLWTHLAELFEHKNVLSHQIVYNEIVPKSGKKDELANWISSYKLNFVTKTHRQLELLPDILKNFPKLIDPASEKEQADPWLVAMMIEIMENDGMFGNQSNYLMVTTENQKSTIKLPAACNHYQIRHINLFDFFSKNDLKFSVTKL